MKNRRRRLAVELVAFAALLGNVFGGAVSGAEGEPDRTILPIPDPKPAPITELDAREATAP
ncbi:hypothetical protein ACYOEI_28015, partial [Singulisphaera rosea]